MGVFFNSRTHCFFALMVHRLQQGLQATMIICLKVAKGGNMEGHLGVRF